MKLAALLFTAALLAIVGCSPDDGSASNAPLMPGYGGMIGGGGIPGGGGTPGGGGSVPGGGGTTPGGGSWCAVEALLKKNCQNCHNEALPFGAPMKLLTHADATAMGPLSHRPLPGEVLERVTRQGSGRMPPTPKPPLAPDEIATLQAWVNAGAPSGVCTAPSSGGAPNAGGAQNAGGVPVAGGAPNTGSVPSAGGQPGTGGATDDPYPPDCIDCANYSCPAGATKLALRAHKNPTPDDRTPYDAGQVGANGQPNKYQCFYYKAKWGAQSQLIGHRPIIDNERVIHHWLLYASNTPPPDLQDGMMREYCQFQPDGNRQLLAGWAPGTPGAMLPANVGQALPHGDNVFITLEVHYFNTQPGPPQLDRSGVEMCITDTPRQNEATMHWLGSEKINIPPNGQYVASDTCTPNTPQTGTILRVWPHMHLTGTHAKMELIRGPSGGGARQILHDGDFAFENQTMYELPQPVTINPGDKIESKCTFVNKEARAIAFGEGSTEEMCYLFTLAYPPGVLHNGKNGCIPLLGCVPGGVRRCIDNENVADVIGGL